MESIKIVVHVYLNINSLFRKKVSILIEYWGGKVIFQLFIHAWGKITEILEKSGNFLRGKKWEPC